MCYHDILHPHHLIIYLYYTGMQKEMLSTQDSILSTKHNKERAALQADITIELLCHLFLLLILWYDSRR